MSSLIIPQAVQLTRAKVNVTSPPDLEQQNSINIDTGYHGSSMQTTIEQPSDPCLNLKKMSDR